MPSGSDRQRLSTYRRIERERQEGPALRSPGEGGCVYAEPECRGCRNRPKVRCRLNGLTVPAGACEACHDALALEDVRIGAVITAWNEGAEVAATVESLRQSVVSARLTVILVDDGSEDGSCHAYPQEGVELVRHDRPLGVGRSRNEGWRRAVALGCHAVSFHDAHMRFPEGTLERLAVKALRERCVVSAASRDIPSRGVQCGCWLHYDPRYGLQPKWVADLPPGWQRTPCMMGAGYVLGTRTGLDLEAATGQLWEDTAGRWGFSEEPLSVKAYLLGIPVLANRARVLDHKYREGNPVPGAAREVWKNVARATAVLFGPQVYARRFAAWCQAHVKPKELAAILSEAFEIHAAAAWEVDPKTVWTHLLGAGAPITGLHPEHAWLPEVEAACRSLASSSSSGVRALVWRPGEAMMLVRRMLPEAKITAVETPGHRYQTWRAACAAAEVDLRLAELGQGYVTPPPGRWDLALIGGEMQAECRASAQAEHALCNEHADRLQLENDERKKEARALAEFEAARAAGPTGDSPSPSSPAATPSLAGAKPAEGGRSPVTVCLLSWRRPENIGLILDTIAQQTVPARVVLWNNGEPIFFVKDGDELPISEHPLVDLVVQPARNLGCFPRWWLASMATTEWVCSLDDDLSLATTDALEVAIAAAQAGCPDGITGAFGVQLRPERVYRKGRHINRPGKDVRVDVVKGRFMLFRRALLERVPLHVPALDELGELHHREDDVWLSLCLGRGVKRGHLLAGALRKRFRELPAPGAASGQPGHWQRRQRTIEIIRDWLKRRD